MLIKDPAKRPSIKKILEMPFMKSKIHELFSSTVKIHDLCLEKETACNSSTAKPELSSTNTKGEEKEKEKKLSKEKILTMFKKKEDVSKEKKIEAVSKNNSGLGFKKKGDAPESSKEAKILLRRAPLKECANTNTSRSSRKEEPSGDKNKKKETHEKSVFEEEETL
jgi:hypothetical protein